ncbi:MAG: hypothetical protein WCS43_15450 [Verrucomicrobiota bacterium]
MPHNLLRHPRVLADPMSVADVTTIVRGWLVQTPTAQRQPKHLNNGWGNPETERA